MKTTTLEAELKRKICAQIRVVPEGKDRFRVFTPFRFDDGDLLSLILKRDSGRWAFTDEGGTFMRLTYDIDEKTIMSGTRGTIIEGTLESNGIEDREGVLWSKVERASYGDALFSLIQAVLRISDLTAWTKTAVRDTFLADLRKVVIASANKDAVQERYRQATERMVRTMIRDGADPADCDQLVSRMWKMECAVLCDCGDKWAESKNWTTWTGGYPKPQENRP